MRGMTVARIRWIAGGVAALVAGIAGFLLPLPGAVRGAVAAALPPAPVLFASDWDSGADGVVLQWTWDDADGQPVTYEVWRTYAHPAHNDPVLTPMLIGCVPAVQPGVAAAAKTFLDTDVIRGGVYFYSVRALLSDGTGGLTASTLSGWGIAYPEIVVPDIRGAGWIRWDGGPKYREQGGTHVRVEGWWPFPPLQEFGVVRLYGRFDDAEQIWLQSILRPEDVGADSFRVDRLAYAMTDLWYASEARIAFPYDATFDYDFGQTAEYYLNTPPSLVVQVASVKVSRTAISTSVKLSGRILHDSVTPEGAVPPPYLPVSPESALEDLYLALGGATLLDEVADPGVWKKSVSLSKGGAKVTYKSSTHTGTRRKFVYNAWNRVESGAPGSKKSNKGGEFKLTVWILGNDYPADGSLEVWSGRNGAVVDTGWVPE